MCNFWAGVSQPGIRKSCLLKNKHFRPNIWRRSLFRMWGPRCDQNVLKLESHASSMATPVNRRGQTQMLKTVMVTILMVYSIVSEDHHCYRRCADAQSRRDMCGHTSKPRLCTVCFRASLVTSLWFKALDPKSPTVTTDAPVPNVDVASAVTPANRGKHQCLSTVMIIISY